MTRAERRRQEKVAAKKPATYTLTSEQIEAIKQDAVERATDTAFILMLGLPVMVLHDKFDKIWKRENRLEHFTDELLDLYDGFNRGYFTLDDVLKTLEEETGVKIRKKR